jgi:hypothetical protein
MHNLSRRNQLELLGFISTQFNDFIALTTKKTDETVLKKEITVMLQFIKDLLSDYNFDIDLREKLIDSSELILAYSETLITHNNQQSIARVA